LRSKHNDFRCAAKFIAKIKSWPVDAFQTSIRSIIRRRIAGARTPPSCVHSKGTTLEMKPHGPRQNSRLDVAPNGDKIVRGRRVRHPFGLLFDDRALT
jgi:hypothetical protein